MNAAFVLRRLFGLFAVFCLLVVGGALVYTLFVQGLKVFLLSVGVVVVLFGGGAAYAAWTEGLVT